MEIDTSVFDFHQKVKEVILKEYKLNRELIMLKRCLRYKCMSPAAFYVQVLEVNNPYLINDVTAVTRIITNMMKCVPQLRKDGGKLKDSEIKELEDFIPGYIRYLQIVSEYALILFRGNPLPAVELLKWDPKLPLASYVFVDMNDIYTVSAIREHMDVDRILFDMVLDWCNVSSGWSGNVQKIRRTFRWYYEVVFKADEVIYVDRDEISTENLILFLFVYEEVIARQQPMNAIHTHGSYWNTFLKEFSSVPITMRSQDGGNKYIRHSILTAREKIPGKHVKLRSKEFNLFIHNGRRKLPASDVYTATLQIMWELTGKCFLDSSLLNMDKLREGMMFRKIKIRWHSIRDDLVITRLHTLNREQVIMRDFLVRCNVDANAKHKRKRLKPVETLTLFEKSRMESQNITLDYLLYTHSRLISHKAWQQTNKTSTLSAAQLNSEGHVSSGKPDQVESQQ
ncbi:ORF71 [Ostreid herpesvirus 1]|nr:ORF71 [Ostreid herpesvirus 1]